VNAVLNAYKDQTMKLNYNDLEMAFEFVSSGYGYDHSAWLDKESGTIYYDSDASEDELPDDLYENEKYLQVPDKREFGLGKPLAIEFAKANIPDDFDQVYSIFRSRGAYSKYKFLLEKRGALEKWYEFEQESLKNSIIEWCKDNGVRLSI